MKEAAMKSALHDSLTILTLVLLFMLIWRGLAPLIGVST